VRIGAHYPVEYALARQDSHFGAHTHQDGSPGRPLCDSFKAAHETGRAKAIMFFYGAVAIVSSAP
jgi:hypothetical protein